MCVDKTNYCYPLDVLVCQVTITKSHLLKVMIILRPLIRSELFSDFFYINLFILFLAVLGLRCCAWAFSSCGQQGLLFVAVRGLLTAASFLVEEHGLQVHGLQQLWLAGSVVVAQGLQSAGSVVVVHGLSCSVACGIFLDQGSNPCPLLWQADS